MGQVQQSNSIIRIVLAVGIESYDPLRALLQRPAKARLQRRALTQVHRVTNHLNSFRSRHCRGIVCRTVVHYHHCRKPATGAPQHLGYPAALIEGGYYYQCRAWYGQGLLKIGGVHALRTLVFRLSVVHRVYWILVMGRRT
jgi:hypothetical protein